MLNHLLKLLVITSMVACNGGKDEDEDEDTDDTDVADTLYDLQFEATDLLGPLQGAQFYLKIFGSTNPNAPIAEATWEQPEGETTYSQAFPASIPDGTSGLVLLVWVDGDEDGICAPGDAYWQRVTGTTDTPYTDNVTYTFTPSLDLDPGVCIVFNG